VCAHFDDGRLDYNATLANSYEGMHELFRGTNASIKLAWSHGWMFKEADAPTQGWEVYANRQQFHNDEGITLIAGATKLAEQGKLKEGVGLPYTPQGSASSALLSDPPSGFGSLTLLLAVLGGGSPRRPATWSTITRTGMGAKGSATTTSRASTAVCAALHRCASHSTS
jgi:hypothetical protein